MDRKFGPLVVTQPECFVVRAPLGLSSSSSHKPFQDRAQTSELFNHLAKIEYKTLYKPARPMMKGITCPVDSMVYTPMIEFHLIMYSIAKTEYMRTHKLTIGQ